MPNFSQRQLLTEGILKNVLKVAGKGIAGGLRGLKTTADLARSTVKALDPDFYTKISKPLDVGLQKLQTKPLSQAAEAWWRSIWPNAEENHFLEFLEKLGYLPDPIKRKVNGTWRNGSIYVVEVDYDENNKPIPLVDEITGKVVSFKYPLHFKLKDDGSYQMTKSPSATGRRTYLPSSRQSINPSQAYTSQVVPSISPTQKSTVSSSARHPLTSQSVLKQYYKFVKKRGLGIYDPIESNAFGSFLVKVIGISPTATRTLITRVTNKPFAKDRKLKPQQIAKIAQILSQRGTI